MQILRNVQGKFQRVTALIFQSGGELLQPVGLSLALLIQDAPQLTGVPDQLRDAVVLLHKADRFRQEASGVQQGTFLQTEDAQGFHRDAGLADLIARAV